MRTLRGLLIGIATVGILAVGLGEVGNALQQGTPPLGSLLLTTADLPAGFIKNDAQSGAVGPATAAALGGDPAKANDLGGPGWVRSWATRDGSFKLRVLVLDMYNTTNAAEAMQGARNSYRSKGFYPFTAPTVPGGVAAAWVSRDGAEKALVVGFARGTLLFTVVLVAPGSFGDADTGDLGATLAARELRLESARYAGTQPRIVDEADVLVAPAGAAVGYLLLLSCWASFRDPLARRWWRRRRHHRFTPLDDVHATPASVSTLDVTADARALKRSALILLGISLMAVGVTLSGFLPHELNTRIILWASGPALGLAAVAYRSRRGRRRGALWMITGRRRLRATTLFLVGVAAAVFACSCLLSGTLASAGAPDSQDFLGAAACFAAVAGVAHRRARRLSAISAHAAIERDERPLVLYLRSFGDDRLRLRSATLGRASLIDRFSPNRFDSFEEVIVRHLSTIGPVVAVNRPGRGLAPLGAARETISDADWRSVVDNWIERAALVVISAPSGAPSPGLVWELAQVSTEDRWPRTVVVVPPVASEELRTRWERFATESADWPTAAELRSDPSQVLAMIRRGGRWVAITGSKRTEWTYAAAIQAASKAPAEPSATLEPLAAETESRLTRAVPPI